MRLFYISCLILKILTFSGYGQSQPLFQSGDAGYMCFRIPALVTLSSTELIVFAEGRKDGCADFGDVDIVMRKSTDAGLTWSSIEIVVDEGQLQAGNATPILDLYDVNYPSGRLFLFYNTGKASEQQTREGEGIRRGFYRTSSDGGVNWSDPVLISDKTHFDRHGAIENRDHRTLAYAPGHGLQLTYGPLKGRLLVPLNYSKGPPQADFKDYRASAIYSDDHGLSWRVSESLEIPSSNEVMASQLSNGEVLMIVRIQNAAVKNKFLARSSDGGQSWYEQIPVNDLITPVCQSSILFVEGLNALLHLGPNSINQREKLTLWDSADFGKTWQVAREINSGFSAYSDMAYLERNRLALVYEADDYNQIIFERINLNESHNE